MPIACEMQYSGSLGLEGHVIAGYEITASAGQVGPYYGAYAASSGALTTRDRRRSSPITRSPRDGRLQLTLLLVDLQQATERKQPNRREPLELLFDRSYLF